MLTLPHGLNEIPAVLQVAHVYLLYLEKFQDCPIPTDVQSEELFTDMLQSMVLERSSIPNAIARGVDTWIDERSFNNISDDDDEDDDTNDDDQQRKERYAEMEDALYRFFTARVGLRFLTEHHVLSSPIRISNKLEEDLSRTKNETHNTTIQPRSIIGSSIDGDNSNENNSFFGCIQPNCCPSLEVRKVVEAVKKQTMDYYGDGVCPEIQIVDKDIHGGERKNNFTYVPHHLHYMVGELLKNSYRATVKR